MTYTESVLYDILASICVDTDQMHVTGRSNGGSFIWSKIMDRLAATFASAGKLTLDHAGALQFMFLSANSVNQIQSQPESDTFSIMDSVRMDMISHYLSSCLLYTSPSPRDATLSRMPSSA